MNIPILLNVFNRPQKTRQVINALRLAKPRRIFLAADGPRPFHADDSENTQMTRKELSCIDWSCDIKTLYREENLGCDLAVSYAIKWFFEHVNYGLIFEDDCVPHPDLFQFAQELFDLYASDERIMQISGLSPYPNRDYPYDYHFSRTFRCWGWGTWKRAWKLYNESVEVYSDQIKSILRAYYPSHNQYTQRFNQFKAFESGAYNNWDFKWNLACYANNGLAIVPESNLVANIGFDEQSTHTKNKKHWLADLEHERITFPLNHPVFVFADSNPEAVLSKLRYNHLNWRGRIFNQYRRLLGILYNRRGGQP